MMAMVPVTRISLVTGRVNSSKATQFCSWLFVFMASINQVIHSLAECEL